MAPSKKSELAAVVSAPPPAAEPVVKEEAATEPAVGGGDAVESTVTLLDKLTLAIKSYTDLIADHKAFIERLKGAQTNLKAVQKDVIALQKQAAKPGKKQRAQGGSDGTPRPLSGFEKPVSISPELAEFLGEAADVQISRTDVTKRINAYIKENELRNPDNKRIILPNEKLAKLLGTDQMSPAPEITYFNLQSYTSKHFNTAKAAAAPAPSNA